MRPEHDAIVTDLQRIIMESWSDDDINEFFLTGLGDNNSMARYHHSLGQWIRNNYNLWEIPHTPMLINGVDHSPEHPDALSSTILKELYSRGIPQHDTT